MKILLTMNLPYTREFIGAVRSNRGLVEALVARGHQVRVVGPASAGPNAVPLQETLRSLGELGIAVEERGGLFAFRLNGAEVRAAADPGRLPGLIQEQVREMAPDWVFASTEDERQDLLAAALEAAPSRVIYVALTPQMLPFGPTSLFPSLDRARLLGRVAAVSALSGYLAETVRRWTGVEVFVHHPPHFGSGPFPHLGCFGEGHVLLMNACKVKGVSLFAALARALPEVSFAALPGWGTTASDRALLDVLPNVTWFRNERNLDDILRRTSVLVMPSLWPEGFGMTVVDAMLRGIPVLASDQGGLVEAKLGTGYVIPVRPIERYGASREENGLPVPVVPAQDATPWIAALRELLGDREIYERQSAAHREAALRFVSGLSVEPLEEQLRHLEERGTAAAPANGNGSRKATPSTEGIVDQVAGLSPQQQALMMMWMRKKKGAAEPGGAGPVQVIPRVPRDGRLPLSSAQQRLWFLHQLDPDSPAYNIVAALRIRGELPAAVQQRALDAVVLRHESLRATFHAADGQPYQVIHANLSAELEAIDLRGDDPAAQEARLEQIGRAQAGRAFDLERGPLICAALVFLSEEDQVLFLTLHHIISDGWSMSIFSRELMEAARAISEGREPVFPPLPIQYVDFTAWHRRWLSEGVAEAQTAWWRSQLGGVPEPLELPADRPRPAVRSLRGGQRRRWLPGALREEIKVLCQREGVTLFMTLLAAFQALLHRFTGRESIHVGSPVANRTRPEVEGLIGFFVNTLVFRTDLSGDPDFTTLLRRVQDVSLGAFAHQDLPFEALVDALQPDRRLSQNPLVQVMFSVYEDPMKVARLPRSVVTPLELHNGTAKFDLLWEAVDTGDGLRLSAEHSADLFDPAPIDRMLGQFQVLLAAAVAEPGLRLSELPLLAAQEAAQLLGEWNDTRTDFPREASLAELFEARAVERPAAVAARYGDRVLTYGELDREANRLAWHLRGLGVRPGEAVGLFLERSPEMVMAVVGILKAGGAYLPLDPDYPQERLSFMLEDGRVALLVTRDGLQAALPAHGARAVCLDRDRKALKRARNTAPPRWAWGGSPAYVMYTSGSTGRPKGIVIPQRAVSRLVLNTGYVPLSAADRLGQASNVSFDAATFEIWGALLHGGEIVGLHRDTVLSPPVLARELRARGVTALFLTTALFNQVSREVPDAFRTLRFLLVGGQAVDAGRMRAVLAAAPPEHLLHVYGPTESTTFATWFRVACVAPDAATVPIGRPLANTTLYVLDRALQLAPLGVAGELWIGGDGLALGYLHRPEVTAQCFVPHPWSELPGERLYRTGDLVRRLPDGAIQFLGRLDDQVKVRGFRVEPGEIEAALARHPGVEHVAVAPRETSPGELRLVAWVVGRGGAVPTTAELRDFLKQRLPDFMVPSAFVLLAALPLNANGKVDKRALPAPTAASAAESLSGVPPRTRAEEVLAGIWAQVLGREQVGVTDNFFELGGDSILSIQIVARANQAGLALTPKQIFQHQTVAELAEAAGTATGTSADQGLLTGPVPLTPIQRWFFAQDLPEPHHFNQAALLEIRRPLDPRLLTAALDALVLHHDSLRLRFTRDAEGEWHQSYGGAEPAAFSCIDLAGLPAARRRAALEAATARLQAALDLAAGPLLCAALFHTGGEEPGRLFLAVHHLAIDGVSWRILMEDLLLTCERLSRGEPLRLPAKTTSFRRHAERLAERARSPVVRRELAGWLALADDPVRPLPVDFPGARKANLGASEQTVTVELDAEETRALLQEIPRAFRARVDVALLAALLQALARWSGDPSLLVDLEGHGRDELPGEDDLSRTVGWFTSAWPVRLDLPAPADPGEILVAVKERLRSVPGGGLGFGLLRFLGEDADREALRRVPAAEVSFNYLGQFNEGLGEGAAFALAAESPGPARSPRGSRGHLLSLNGVIAEGRLRLHWLYSSAVHRRDTVERLAEAFLTALRGLVDHCRTIATAVLSPSDFPLAGLDAAELRLLLAASESIEDVYPPSPLQELMLLHAFSATGSEILVEHFCCRLHGPLDTAAFRTAWERLAERHAVLRTAFLWEGLSQPLQVVRPAVDVPCQELDWSGSTAVEQEGLLRALLRDDRARGLDPTVAPVMRLTLVRLAPETHQLLWTYHHLLIDGWCLSTLLRELFAHYEAARSGERAGLPRPRPYRDYLEWIQEQDPEQAEAYWRAELAGIAPPRPLGTRRPAPQTDVAEGGRALQVHLTAEATAELNEAARRHRLTLSALVHGAWGLLLAAALGCRDVVFGTTVSGRPAGLRGVESMVGLFINNLPLRLRLDEAEPALTWLRLLQQTQAAMGDAGHVSPLRVQEWSGLPPGVRLFDSLIVFENYPVDASVLDSGGGLRLGEILPGIRTSYPLTLVAAPGPQLLLQLLYDPRLFDGGEVARALDLLADLLAALGASPERRTGDLLQGLAQSGVVLASPDLPAAASLAHLRDGKPLVVPRDPLELQIVRILEEILDVHPVGVTDNFFELGGTSFLAVRLVARIADQLGRNLPLSVLFREPTVERLAILLRREGIPVAGDTLVPIQPHGSRPPLFLVHPAGGTVLCYSDLARALGPGQPVWGLEAAGLYEGEPLDCIEEMARRFVQALRTVQPGGPYHLGGWSFGGFVAFEMARQLAESGEEVGLLALLDTWGPLKSRLRKAIFAARLWIGGKRGDAAAGGHDDAAMLALFTDTHARFHGRETSLRAEEVRARPPEERVGFVLDWMKGAGLLAPDTGKEVMLRFINVYLSSSRALQRYKPRVYDGLITLFRAAELSDQHAYLRKHPGFGDPALGWGTFSRQGVEVHEVPGDHITMGIAPNARMLAERLASCIAREPWIPPQGAGSPRRHLA